MTKQKIHLIHGWTYSLDNWADFIKQLKKAGFAPVLHKVPGLSEPSELEWTVEMYVEWLEDKLKGDEQPIVVGHSNGGRILLAYHKQHPKHIKQMFLIGSAGIIESSTKVRIKRRVGGIAAKIIKPLVPEGRPRRLLYRLIGARDYGNAKPNMRQTMKNMLGYDKHLEIEKIKTPTTLIWGEHDSATPVYQGFEMRDKLRHVTSWNVIRNAGHSPYINHAADVAAIIERDYKELA